jgi:HlyD family secretion protein
MKKWIVLIVFLGAGALGYQQWRRGKPQVDAAAQAGRPTTATVETRDIRFTVNAAGDIGPAEQVSVRPEVNGKVDNLPVDVGDVVKKSDLLFSLDDRDLQTEKQSQDKEIERAKLQLEQAQRGYKRSEQLFNEKLISQELYEDTKTQYELAKNALQRAEKALDLVSERLRKTRIVAPFDCTVLTRPVSVGQAVSGSGGFNSGTEVLTIADLNEMVVNAHINQADVTRLKVGQDVLVSVEAVPGLVVTGKVERVAPQATIKNNIKGFASRILLRDVDRRIRPGMTAAVQIPVAAADNVVAVPLAAVFTELNPDTQQSERFAFVVKGEESERRMLKIGVSDNFYAEVLSGLSAGEVVKIELNKDELAKLSKAKPPEATLGMSGARPASAGALPRPALPASTPASNAARPSVPAAPRPAASPRT